MLSNPIIEDCDRLRFAPSTLRYLQMRAQHEVREARAARQRRPALPRRRLRPCACVTAAVAAVVSQAAGLDKGENRWREVNDFKWHRVQQSPHWSVLPEAERARRSKDAFVSMGDDAEALDAPPPSDAVMTLGAGAPPVVPGAEDSDSDDEL